MRTLIAAFRGTPAETIRFWRELAGKAPAALLVILTLLAISCGGGGGGSPTAPPAPTLNVQGAWEGIWVAPVTVSMNLAQPAGSRDVNGTISALGFTLKVRGSTTFAASGSGTFRWEVYDGGCGSWTGTMAVQGGNLMHGPSRLSTAGCASPDVIEGEMFMSRAGALTSGLRASPSSEGGTLERLAGWLPDNRSMP